MVTGADTAEKAAPLLEIIEQGLADAGRDRSQFGVEAPGLWRGRRSGA
jgi:hypothetical protein